MGGDREKGREKMLGRSLQSDLSIYSAFAELGDEELSSSYSGFWIPEIEQNSYLELANYTPGLLYEIQGS